MALIMAVWNSPPNCKPASRSFALLWMRRARESNRRGAVTGLRIILPKNGCAAVAHRLAALDPKLAVELYEHDAALNILEKIDPQRAGNLDTWLVPHRESEALLAQARSALDAIVGAPRKPLLCILRRNPAKCGCAIVAWRSRAGTMAASVSGLTTPARNLLPLRAQR